MNEKVLAGIRTYVNSLSEGRDYDGILCAKSTGRSDYGVADLEDTLTDRLHTLKHIKESLMVELDDPYDKDQVTKYLQSMCANICSIEELDNAITAYNSAIYNYTALSDGLYLLNLKSVHLDSRISCKYIPVEVFYLFAVNYTSSGKDITYRVLPDSAVVLKIEENPVVVLLLNDTSDELYAYSARYYSPDKYFYTGTQIPHPVKAIEEFDTSSDSNFFMLGVDAVKFFDKYRIKL